jgi:hypothetical protein
LFIVTVRSGVVIKVRGSSPDNTHPAWSTLPSVDSTFQFEMFLSMA